MTSIAELYRQEMTSSNPNYMPIDNRMDMLMNPHTADKIDNTHLNPNLIYNQNISNQHNNSQTNSPDKYYSNMNPHSKHNLDQILDDINDNPPTKLKKKNKNKNKKNNNPINYQKYFKEGILLVVIYVLYSNSVVRKFFANYITQLNKGPDGKVSIIGLIIYGIIIATTFLISKYYLLDK